jgi:hypothetical protein
MRSQKVLPDTVSAGPPELCELADAGDQNSIPSSWQGKRRCGDNKRHGRAASRFVPSFEVSFREVGRLAVGEPGGNIGWLRWSTSRTRLLTGWPNSA